MSCVAIITARGGSKRIPRKNIRPFLGRPIIEYSISAAIKSNCFDEIMVSTDDEEIAQIALKLGAKVPFKRSPKNSDDHSSTADVILEVLDEYSKLSKYFNYACGIYPTAPFVSPGILRKAFDIISKNDAQSVVPIVKFGFPILRSFSLTKENYVKVNWPEYINSRSQDLAPAFHDAGQFYFLNVNNFIKEKRLFTESTVGIETLESEVQDIDTEEDWKIAELKYKLMIRND